MKKDIKTPEFPVGIQCYFNFELAKVEEVNQGRVYCVEFIEREGWVTQYDLTNSCFPAIPAVKEISTQFLQVKKAFDDAKLTWHGKLSFKEELEKRWREICLLLTSEKKFKEFNKKYKSWIVLATKIYKRAVFANMLRDH